MVAPATPVYLEWNGHVKLMALFDFGVSKCKKKKN